MRNFLGNLYFHKLFFRAFAGLSILFLLSYWIPGMFFIVSMLVLGFVGVTLVDTWLLFRVKEGVLASRMAPDKFSNSDVNEIHIPLKSR